jgi:glycosyltransferase involved in cell wall biosynthesis
MRKYLAITDLAFPMGGGESFMRQTCIDLENLAECYWLNFSSHGNGYYRGNRIEKKDFYTQIQASSSNWDAQIRDTIRDIRPDLIHSIGHLNPTVKKIAEELGIPCMIGYHFWTNFIEINSNCNILQNIKSAKISKNFESETSTTYEYVASEFMEEVYRAAGGREPINILYPLSHSKDFIFDKNSLLTDDKYILIMNMAKLKGGHTFIECAKKLPDIKFLGVISESIDEETEDLNSISNLTISGFKKPSDLYSGAQLLMIPSEVDETFCRVAYEAALNNIPIISTSNGFIKNLLGDTGIFLKPHEFSTWIKENYNNSGVLKKISASQKQHVQKICTPHIGKFKEIALSLMQKSINHNTAIFTAWGDQGLGNLSYLYAKTLRSIGHKVHIFSFQSYASINKSLINQENPQDWDVPNNADSVYYSYNTREEVGLNEFLQFCRCNKVRNIIMPEVCFLTNWSRLNSLRDIGYNVITVPMIEIVRDDEIDLHNDFDLTLCCTNQAFNVLKSFQINNLEYIGHGYKSIDDSSLLIQKLESLKKRHKIKFLHVAGHNPLHRKNTKKVIRAFTMALEKRKDIELTITTLVQSSVFVEGQLPPEITVIDTPLPREAIETLYAEHDVSIQVPSHEGLGLGFFESLQKLTPIISMNAAPHNEFIEHNISGILIDCQYMDIDDNKHSIVNAWDFQDEKLCNAIFEINKDKVSQLINNIYDLYNIKFSESAFLIRLDNALRKLSATPNKYHFDSGWLLYKPMNNEAIDSSTTVIVTTDPGKSTSTNIVKIFVDKFKSLITVRINRKIRKIIYEAVHEFWNTQSIQFNESAKKLDQISEKIDILYKRRR